MGRPLPAVAVSTPGKLILMGEHAVVYGRPALVAAIDLRLRATFSPLAPASSPHPAQSIEIDLPGLSHRTHTTWEEVLAYTRQARDGWAAYAARPGVAGFLALRGEDPAHIVKVALGEAAALGGTAGGAPPPFHLRLDSALPVGAGFGSSAAAAVAVVAGYALWRREAGAPAADPGRRGPAAAVGARAGPDLALDFAEIERLALEAERRQHGLPSGVDTATSLYGGLLWAERGATGELRREPLATGSPLLARLRVFHTGTPPEPTGEVVAAVRARRDRDPRGHDRLFDRIAAATLGLRREIERTAPGADRAGAGADDAAAGVDRSAAGTGGGGPAADPAEAGSASAAPAAERVTALLREAQECLEALGVVPAPVRALVRQVEAAGGAAKISGAGSLAGPGGGSILVYHPEAERIADWPFLRHLTPYPVHLGTAGFRQDFP